MTTMEFVRLCPPTDNPILFVLVFLLRMEGFASVDVDLPIESLFGDDFTATDLLWLGMFLELVYSIDAPNSVVENHQLTIREFADRIRESRPLTSKEYGRRLVFAQALLKGADTN